MKCTEKSCIFPGTVGGLCATHAMMFPASLMELESVIERGMRAFLPVANALATIHERKLYAQAGYKTYTDYCRERWGLALCSAYQYLRAKSVVDELPEAQAQSVSLHQAVELSRMTPAQRKGCIRDGDLSAMSVRELRSYRRGQPENKNAADLKRFAEFCGRHPELTFKEAVEEWLYRDGSQVALSA